MDIEEDVGMWLEDIYERSDMFCRLERIDLTAPSAQSMKSNNEVGNSINPIVSCCLAPSLFLLLVLPFSSYSMTTYVSLTSL